MNIACSTMMPRTLSLLVVALFLSPTVRADEVEVRHGPYFHYLWSQVEGPTFDGEHIAGRGVRIGRTEPATGFSTGYQVTLTQPSLGPGLGFAAGVSEWGAARFGDFTAASQPYSNATASYWFVDLVLVADLWYGALYGGFGVGSRGMSFDDTQSHYDDGQMTGSWFAGVRVSPVLIAVGLITRRSAVAEGWAKTFDLALTAEYRYVPGSEQCDGPVYTDGSCAVDTTKITDGANIRSLGVGLTVDLGALFSEARRQRWEDDDARR